jgi:hypothetical protein
VVDDDMKLTLAPAARARFTAWLQDVGSAELRADVVESEMLQSMEDRAESGESMSYELGRQYTTTGQPELFYADAKDFDDMERDATLESAFADAIGHDKYQLLLDEKWLPFAGKAHLSMSLADAVAREVKAATEFLQSLDDGETSIAAPAIETETWIAWLDGKRDEAVTFEVPLGGTFDVAEAGAAALGVDVSENLNVQRA